MKEEVRGRLSCWKKGEGPKEVEEEHLKFTPDHMTDTRSKVNQGQLRRPAAVADPTTEAFWEIWGRFSSGALQLR